MKPKQLAVGVQVVDMHGRTLEEHEELNEHYEVRNITMFHLPGPGSFSAFLSGVCRYYHNKMLVVIDEPWYGEDDWWPCAFSYDGNYGGTCQIKERKS